MSGAGLRGFLAAVVIAGCGNTQAADERTLLCPDCVPSVGGETSDFGGGSACYGEELALTDALAEAWRVPVIVDAHSGSFESTLRWHPVDARSLPFDTTVWFSLMPGEPQYFQSTSPDCEDWITLGVRVELATGDASLSATLDGSVSILRGDVTPTLEASADLGSASGRLELSVDLSRPHAGRLELVLERSPEGTRGAIHPKVLYFEDGFHARAWAGGARLIEGTPAPTPCGVFPQDAPIGAPCTSP